MIEAVVAARVGQHDVARVVEVRVLHEVAADEAPPVAEPALLLAVRQQQQPRVLDPSRREHDVLRREGESRAVERRRLDAPHARDRLVRPQSGRVGVEQHAYAPRALQLGPELLPEAHGRAEVERTRHNARRIERQDPRGPGVARVVEGLDLEDLGGPSVVRHEVGLADRPAARRHPGTGLEVDRVERTAPALPVVRRAAEIAHPRD